MQAARFRICQRNCTQPASGGAVGVPPIDGIGTRSLIQTSKAFTNRHIPVHVADYRAPAFLQKDENEYQSVLGM